MAGSYDINIVTIDLGGTITASDAFLALKAPADNHGGGIRILEAVAVNHAATSSTNSFTLGLLKYSNAGTPAVNGTIAAAIGGTGNHWADGVPKDFTIDSAQAFLDAGEWLALDHVTQGTGVSTKLRVQVSYIMGK